MRYTHSKYIKCLFTNMRICITLPLINWVWLINRVWLTELITIIFPDAYHNFRKPPSIFLSLKEIIGKQPLLWTTCDVYNFLAWSFLFPLFSASFKKLIHKQKVKRTAFNWCIHSQVQIIKKLIVLISICSMSKEYFHKKECTASKLRYQ